MDELKEKVDQLITSSLNRDEEPVIPDNFAFKMMQKIEARIIRKNLLNDWAAKILLVFLIGLVIFVSSLFTGMYNLFEMQKTGVLIYVVCAALIICFIYFADQVVLKYMFHRFNQKHSENKQG